MDESNERPLLLACGDYEALVDPDQGGSLRSLRWRGEDIMRAQVKPGVLNSACFPLVPFSNRIAGSAFHWNGREVVLQPNHPTDIHEPVLHGFGWVTRWIVIEATERRASLQMSAHPQGWPGPFRCTQTIELNPAGLTIELSLFNEGREPMPAGLGFHPFFPLDQATRYHGLHRGEWEVDANLIPVTLRAADKAQDWWNGDPVAARSVDTVYTEREGSLIIQWPNRNLGIEITPSPNLSFTTVYVPPGAEFFCVEPVSHATDSFNRPGGDGPEALDPGAELAASIRIRAFEASAEQISTRALVHARSLSDLT